MGQCRPTDGHRRAMLIGGLLAGSAMGSTRAQSQRGDSPDSFEPILERLRAEYRSQSVPPEAERWARTLPDSGLWPDVDYVDRSEGDWRPIQHMSRLRAIALAMRKPGHTLYQQAIARQALERGLRAWLLRRPTSNNWWQNTIGLQLHLMPVLVMGAGLIDPLLEAEASGLLADPGQVPADRATGQNLVWYATQQLVRGTLRSAAEDVAAASNAFRSTLRVTPLEGLQADMSFHQHEAQLYSGGYGLGFLQDHVRVATWLSGTAWAYAHAELQLLADYALDGVLPLIRGTWLDWSARGREFTRDERVPRPRLVRAALQQMLPLVPSRRQALQEAIRHLDAGTPPRLGNRLYWRSDFMVHHTSRGYLSVKMVSARTVGTESGNGENLRGFWLPFGVTYLLRRGDEYDALPPVWDWSLLPGVTAPAEVPPLQGYQRHVSRFVGGLSDGRSGVAAMVLDKLQTQALRAWFFHGEMMIALGADVRSSRDTALRTSLNQTRWSGDVVSDLGPLRGSNNEIDLTGRRWLWHAGITYLLLDTRRPVLKMDARESDGRAINATLGRHLSERSAVWSLWLDHGLRPQGEVYAYAVWMGADSAVEAARAPTPRVLSNTTALQAVHHADDGPVQAVFHRPGTLVIDELNKVVVDAPCLLTTQGNARTGWLTHVSDPTRTSDSLGLRWLREGRTVKEGRVPLPSDRQASPQSSWFIPA